MEFQSIQFLELCSCCDVKITGGAVPLWGPEIHTGTKRMHFFFQIIVTFLFSIWKNYVNTKTTCNKCSFDYLHWLLNYGKLYQKDGVLLAVHTSGASPQSSASHLLTFLVAQFLREWKLSERWLYEVFERRLLIWGNHKERNSPDYYPFQKHAFFLRHPVSCKLCCVHAGFAEWAEPATAAASVDLTSWLRYNSLRWPGAECPSHGGAIWRSIWTRLSESWVWWPESACG